MTARVRILPSRHEFTAEGNDTILDAALRSGLALDYGCSNGNCGLCKAHVVSGETSKLRPHDYRITEAGRRVLAEQREDWSRFVAALGQVAGVKYA